MESKVLEAVQGALGGQPVYAAARRAGVSQSSAYRIMKAQDSAYLANIERLVEAHGFRLMLVPKDGGI